MTTFIPDYLTTDPYSDPEYLQATAVKSAEVDAGFVSNYIDDDEARLYQRELRNAEIRERARCDAQRKLQEERDAADAEAAKYRLPFKTPAQMRADKAARGPRTWLLKNLWISRTAMVIGAEEKLGKSVSLADMAVAIASGGKFLNHFQVEQTGPVIIFMGEDDEDEVLSRLDAIAEFYGVDLDELPITVCCQAPNLSSEESLQNLREALKETEAIAVLLDPLYLAAGEDAESSNLYKMGMLLNRFKQVCAEFSAAPCVVTHFKKTPGANGSQKITGTGTTQWARTIFWGEKAAERDEDGKYHVDLVWEAKGNSIRPVKQVFRRVMWSEDPDDVLNSPLHYEIEPVEAGSGGGTTVKEIRAEFGAKLRADNRVLVALEAAQQWMSKHDVRDWDADHLPSTLDGTKANQLKGDTAYRALEKAHAAGKVQKTQSGTAWLYAAPGVAKPDDMEAPIGPEPESMPEGGFYF